MGSRDSADEALFKWCDQDFDAISSIVDYLGPFTYFSDLLRGDNIPSLPFVWPMLSSLDKHCGEWAMKDDDSLPDLKRTTDDIRTRVREEYGKLFQSSNDIPSPPLVLATLLHPHFAVA